LCDQAALAGVLRTLYEMHLTLISVQRREIERIDKSDCGGTD
jgi:hypothetical protein